MSQWYYAQNGQQLGPVEITALQQMLSSGALLPTDLVWHEGMPQWTPAENMPELSVHLSQPLSQPAPDSPSPAPSSSPDSSPVPILNYSMPPTQAQRGENGKCIASLVLGILSIPLSIPICCYVGFATGPLAIIFGMTALSNMKRHGNVQGRGMAIAGITLGIIGTILAGIVVAIVATLSSFAA